MVGVKLPPVTGTSEVATNAVARFACHAARMPIIYRKTAKGVNEIETRAHRLVPRARSALIMVDGKRDAMALAGLIQQAAETLTMLAEQGFIEAAGASASAKLAALVPAPAPSRTPPAAQTAASPEFVARRRAAVRALNDALGPTGEALAVRMERARDPGELAPLLQVAVQLIGNVRGRAAAEAFAARHST